LRTKNQRTVKNRKNKKGWLGFALWVTHSALSRYINEQHNYREKCTHHSGEEPRRTQEPGYRCKKRYRQREAHACKDPGYKAQHSKQQNDFSFTSQSLHQPTIFTWNLKQGVTAEIVTAVTRKFKTALISSCRETSQAERM
jgi:hypothetical protein